MIIENIGLLSYVLIGLIYTKWEHDCFEIDFSECSPGVVFWFIVQQICHYGRITATWPSYAVEDFAVYMTNRLAGWDDEDLYEEDEDEEEKDEEDEGEDKKDD